MHAHTHIRAHIHSHPHSRVTLEEVKIDYVMLGPTCRFFSSVCLSVTPPSPRKNTSPPTYNYTPVTTNSTNDDATKSQLLNSAV